MDRTTALAGIFVVGAGLLNGGCASIISGNSQEVSFQSSPQGVTVTVSGRVIGQTPVTARLDKKSNQTLTFSKDGYKPVEMQLTTQLDPWFWGNIVLGGFIGSTVDGLSGAVNQYSPSQYFITLESGKVSKLEAPMLKSWHDQTKEFIVARHRQIVAEVHNGRGENVNALLALLNVPNERESDELKKLRDLSDASSDAVAFADQVLHVYLQ